MTSSGAVVNEMAQRVLRHALEEIHSAGARAEGLVQEIDRARRLLEISVAQTQWRSAAGAKCRHEAEEIQRELSRVVDECSQAVDVLRSFETRRLR
ncbi:hypothetical protein [Austwickia chelonae]|uniref:hypothetical protein n=1 Tax=Austwickia chelonae TaxID=100225 RepID=UPI000E270522|nr:hypothetical protein [Austwickia chelonae]